MKAILLLVAVVALYSHFACADPSDFLRVYTHSNQLHSKYILHWDVVGDELYIGIEATTLGWVGFGLGEPTSGSMPGADIVTGWIEADGTIKIQDRHALAKEQPIIDICQDWQLVGGKETGDGRTILEVKRKLVTDDPQDREIRTPTQTMIDSGVQYTTRIVFAFGLTDTFGQHEATNRGSNAINFFPEMYPAAGPVSNDTHTVEYLIKNYTISSTSATEYVCQSYILESDEQHIIQLEAVINPATAQYVHHFGVIVCPLSNDTWFTSRLDNPRNCFAGGRSACGYTLWGWAPGSGPLVLPETVGFRSGNGTGLYAVHVQIHYDNPGLDAGMVDNSGFRVTYSTKFRAQDAGALTLGDPFVSGVDIPAGQAHVHYEFGCTASCTSTWPHDINVFAQWMHGHMALAQAYTTHHKTGTAANAVGILSQVDFWDFGYQLTVPLEAELVIKRGDRLNTHCIYNTLDRTDPTPFFIGSQDEMCVQILYYYPALSIANCGFYRDENGGGGNFTACGSRNDLINETNPSAFDPPVLDVIEFGRPLTEGECQLSTGGEETTDDMKSAAPAGFAAGIRRELQFILVLTVIVAAMFLALS